MVLCLAVPWVCETLQSENSQDWKAPPLDPRTRKTLNFKEEAQSSSPSHRSCRDPPKTCLSVITDYSARARGWVTWAAAFQLRHPPLGEAQGARPTAPDVSGIGTLPSPTGSPSCWAALQPCLACPNLEFHPLTSALDGISLLRWSPPTHASREHPSISWGKPSLTWTGRLD